MAQAGLPADTLGAVVLPLDHAGRPWHYRSGVAMQPGSAMKLVTTVVALDRLGGTHTGRTRLLAAGPVSEGVLQGDLVLQGGADPDFGLATWWLMLRELRDQGITRITGDLVLDRHRYRPARLDIGVPPFDERPESWWNVIPDALPLDLGLQTLELMADDGTLRARLKPAVAGLRVDTSRMTLNDKPCTNWSDEWVSPLRLDEPAATPGAAPGAVLVLQGAFPRRCIRNEDLQAADRTRYAGLAFAQTWRELGGQWDGRVREAEAAAPETLRVLAQRRSRPWGEMLRMMVKTSDNTLARLLFLELGVPAMAAQPQATTLDLARQAVQGWYAQQGIEAPGLVVDNGSGLSRSERISAQTLAQTVAWAWHSRHAPDVLMTLPVVGVDGTMRNRLKESPATGVARLKTGTLRNVRALTGVVVDPQGRTWALAAMINSETQIDAGRAVLDLLVDRIARGDLGR
jgi:D-alanyl-D-alanine carboxypeptidase/D-alanyl-D-alanine-endopeptidase (penicillin-binding protein 4)